MTKNLLDLDALFAKAVEKKRDRHFPNVLLGAKKAASVWGKINEFAMISKLRFGMDFCEARGFREHLLDILGPITVYQSGQLDPAFDDALWELNQVNAASYYRMNVTRTNAKFDFASWVSQWDDDNATVYSLLRISVDMYVDDIIEYNGFDRDDAKRLVEIMVLGGYTAMSHYLPDGYTLTLIDERANTVWSAVSRLVSADDECE